MHGAAHGRLGVQEMVDRLATRELAKEHYIWFSVYICYVLCIGCVCVCDADTAFPDPLLLTFLLLLPKATVFRHGTKHGSEQNGHKTDELECKGDQ